MGSHLDFNGREVIRHNMKLSNKEHILNLLFRITEKQYMENFNLIKKDTLQIKKRLFLNIFTAHTTQNIFMAFKIDPKRFFFFFN